MSKLRLIALTSLAMVAFAGNSLLCRQALQGHHADAGRFTLLRLVSGAAVLAMLARGRGAGLDARGNWPSAIALFVYAAGFSFAYLTLPVATGALLLFGAVQVSMVGIAVVRGARLDARESVGLAIAFAGLLALLAPGIAAPTPFGATLMITAGIAWGIYSLRGRGGGDPIVVTAGNFLRAAPIAIALGLWRVGDAGTDSEGVALALASGALASGVGYAIWYTALPQLSAAGAAIVQLSVPALAALGGYLFLGEAVSLRLMLAAAAILGGIALSTFARRAH